MAWHGMAWNGTAWHGTAWNGMGRHGRGWHGMARHGMAQHNMAQHNTAWHSWAWHGMAQHSTEWHGMAWNGTAGSEQSHSPGRAGPCVCVPAQAGWHCGRVPVAVSPRPCHRGRVPSCSPLSPALPGPQAGSGSRVMPGRCWEDQIYCKYIRAGFLPVFLCVCVLCIWLSKLMMWAFPPVQLHILRLLRNIVKQKI